MDLTELKKVIEAALLASPLPLTVGQLDQLFADEEKPGASLIKQALAELDLDFEGRAIELIEVASGYRIQVKTSMMPFLGKLWEDRPPRYSRALLETLAIVAYRQPITRGDIEQIRGVSVSSNILRTLQERDWIKVIGHRDVPGRPELLGTTKAFLDYFNLKSLNELPTLAEIKDIDDLEPQLALDDPELAQPSPNDEPATDEPSQASDHNTPPPEETADIDETPSSRETLH